MIFRYVSCVITIKDGFNEKPLNGSSVRIMLDGEKYKCIVKDDGLFVFIDLKDGDHLIKLSGNGYQTEVINLTTDKDNCIELMHYMKPTVQYRFGRKVTTLGITLQNNNKASAEEALYTIDSSSYKTMKIAQENAEKGTDDLRVFCPQKITQLSIPSLYYIDDGTKGEMVKIVKTQEDERIVVDKPLKYSHKRGTRLCSIKEYYSREDGRVFIAVSSNLILLRLNGNKYIKLQPKLDEYKHNEIKWKV